ncbi:MAG: AgmX/PglI C-terminal domain-containing protein [Deltaproteobacteria bacterium]
MKKWLGLALGIAGVCGLLLVMQDADGTDAVPAAEAPAEVAPNEAVPEEAPAAAAVAESPERSTPKVDRAEPSEVAPDTSAKPTKARTSLVEKAWAERASQKAFQGEDYDKNIKYPLTKDGIQSAVRARKDELTACYEDWQKMQPELGGRLVTRFEITRDEENADVARIREVSLPESELDNVFMEGCVRQVMETLKFDPPSSGKLTVNYPLSFSSAEEKAED